MAQARYMNLQGDPITEDDQPTPPVHEFASAVSPRDEGDSEHVHEDVSFFEQTAALQSMLESHPNPGLDSIRSFIGGLADNKSPGFLGSVSRTAGGIGLRLLNAVGITHTLSSDAKQNIRSVMQASLNVYGNDTIRARLSVAQAVLESGLSHNPSTLAARYNNLFGIKARNGDMAADMGTNEVINGQTVHIRARFAAYATAEDSVAAHAALLNKPRYTSVMNARTFEEAAIAVQQSGYCTDPGYAESLIKVDRMISSFTADMRPNAQLSSNVHPAAPKLTTPHGLRPAANPTG